MFYLKIFLAASLLFFGGCSWLGPNEEPSFVRKLAQTENQSDLPRVISDLEVSSAQEQARRLRNARVIYADYDLLKNDFPHLQNLENSEIDRWLIENGALVSSRQAMQDHANSRIPVTDEVIQAYRPPDYGRALVASVEFSENSLSSKENEMKVIVEHLLDLRNYLANRASWNGTYGRRSIAVAQLIQRFTSTHGEINPEIKDVMSSLNEASRTRNTNSVEEIGVKLRELYSPFRGESGLIDIKGAGSLAPRRGDHSDGLITLGESIREYLYEKMVNGIFRNEGGELKTVQSYAVIDAGFDVMHADGSSSPAGLYLRQAHVRATGKYSLFNQPDSLRIESVLRKYGVTSAGAYRDQHPYDRINIQGTRSGAVLDFGGFLVLEEFDINRPAKHFYGAPNLINSSNFVTPDDSIRVPYNVWGSSVSGVEDPKLDNVWLWSHELARALSEGRASRGDAENHLRNMLSPVFANFNGGSGSCSESLMQIMGGI